MVTIFLGQTSVYMLVRLHGFVLILVMTLGRSPAQSGVLCPGGKQNEGIEGEGRGHVGDNC